MCKKTHDFQTGKKLQIGKKISNLTEKISKLEAEEHHMETIQDIAKDVGINTDIVLDCMIDST